MLYRDPMRQSVSALRAARLEGSRSDLPSFLNYWVDKNTELLAEASRVGGNYLLRLEDFQANPGETIEKICRAFGLTYTLAWKVYWEKVQHPIGGNFNPWTYLLTGEIGLARIDAKSFQEAPSCELGDARRLLKLLDSHRLNLRSL